MITFLGLNFGFAQLLISSGRLPLSAALGPPAFAPAVPAMQPPAFAVGDNWTYRVLNLLDQTERRGTMRVKAIRGDEVFYANGNVGDVVGNMSRVVRPGGVVEVMQPSNHFYLFPNERRTVQVEWDGVPPEERELIVKGWNMAEVRVVVTASAVPGTRND
jgi:hypothetical protein